MSFRAGTHLEATSATDFEKESNFGRHSKLHSELLRRHTPTLHDRDDSENVEKANTKTSHCPSRSSVG